MIRPYLRDLINEHKPIDESNNESNDESNDENDDIDRTEWKIQLAMQNSCIYITSFEETRTLYTKSEPVEIFMGSDTNDVIDKIFNTLLQRFQQAQETLNDNGSEFIPDSVELLYYHFQRIDIRRAKSYIMSPDWIASKKATRVDTDFLSYQRDWEEFEQNNTLIALNILFVSCNSEEIKLGYKSNYNKRKNQVILLMINAETNNCYYFAVKN